MKIILIFLMIVFQFSFASETFKKSKIAKGKKIKILEQENNILRIYIFTDISACFICNENITRIDNQFSSNNNIELKVIFSSLNQENAKSIKENNNWNLDVIGDQHNIYFDFYDIRKLPFIVVLSNDGIVLDFAKLGSDITIDKLEKHYQNEVKNTNSKIINKNLIELKRIKVVNKQGKKLLSGRTHREMIIDTSRNEFYYRKKAAVKAHKIDSSGLILREINYYNNPNLRGYKGLIGLSWAEQDSLLCFYNAYGKYEPIIQLYDVKKDSIVKNITFSMKSIDSNLRKHFYTKCFTGKNLFFKPYRLSNQYNNQKLHKSTNTSFLFGFNGKCISRFNSPDSIFQEFKISEWFLEITAIVDSNIFITNQMFSNILKYWDFKGNKIKEIELDLGKSFKTITAKTVQYLHNNNIPKFESNISRKNQLLYDQKMKRSLVCYYTDSYPPGVVSHLSPKIKTNKYIVISDDDGNRLTKKPIKVDKTFIPFYFYDNILYGSELDNERQLEIVIYKFIPKNQ